MVKQWITMAGIIIFTMKGRILIGVVILILIAGALITFYTWISTPKLVETYPAQGATNVPATTGIRLVFSRPMQQGSVIDHLNIQPNIEGSYAWNGNALTYTPEQAWPPGSQIDVTLKAGARATGWLSFPMGRESWSFTTNQAMLAYLWPSESEADIYALTPTSGEIIRYTHGMGVLDFTVSSTGLLIYFSAGNAEGGANLYQINRSEVLAAGQNEYQIEELLDCGSAQCRNPTASFDSLYLAYEYIIPDPGGGLGPAQVWLLDLMTKNVSRISQESHETVQPGWSSKGMLAYYDRTSSGYEVTDPISLDRLLIQNQTGQPGEWSPDGLFYLAPELYYYRAPDNTERGTSHLIQYKITDQSNTDISQSLDVEDAEAVYAPDGSRIAFARKYLDASHWTLGRQIWIMTSTGLDAHAITDEADYNHYDLAWSRDGKLLAYVRFDETRVYNPPELWMIESDGSNPTQMVIGGYSPVWIP